MPESFEAGECYRIDGITAIPFTTKRLFGIPESNPLKPTEYVLHLVSPTDEHDMILATILAAERKEFRVGGYVQLDIRPLSRKEAAFWAKVPLRKKKFGEV